MKCGKVKYSIFFFLFSMNVS